jgi:hypothetical protein
MIENFFAKVVAEFFVSVLVRLIGRFGNSDYASDIVHSLLKCRDHFGAGRTVPTAAIALSRILLPTQRTRGAIVFSAVVAACSLSLPSLVAQLFSAVFGMLHIVLPAAAVLVLAIALIVESSVVAMLLAPFAMRLYIHLERRQSRALAGCVFLFASAYIGWQLATALVNVAFLLRLSPAAVAASLTPTLCIVGALALVAFLLGRIGRRIRARGPSLVSWAARLSDEYFSPKEADLNDATDDWFDWNEAFKEK